MTNRKSKSKDFTWEHCKKVDDKNRMYLECNYCKKSYWGGVVRMKNHLAGTHVEVLPCPQVSEEIREKFCKILHDKKKNNDADFIINVEDDDNTQGGKANPFLFQGKKKGISIGNQKTINAIMKPRETVIQDICRFIYGNALPFNLVKSPLFVKMLNSIAEYGKGLKPPSYHEARVTCLEKEVKNVEITLEKYKSEWKRTGCTLMSDGWTDGKGRSLTNFLVYSPSGTVFLNSLDTSADIKDARRLFALLDSIIDEIGEENVVQVVTDSASAYVAAGRLLEDKRKNLFWSPCAAHCLDLILSDIGEIPIFHNTISKAKQITVFIYRHTWVLNLFRRYSKGVELARPAVTRFATAFITLQSIQDKRSALKSMFASQEWEKSSSSHKQGAKTAQDTVLSDKRFWKAVTYCITCVTPLVKVLKMVDGDAKPSMGYIYEAMDRAKEQIAANFDNCISRYRRVWEIIDARWNLQLHRPLHAAAYYLNPKFHYSLDFNPDTEVKVGLFKTIERMYPDVETRVKIDAQLESFKRAEGMFGISMAIATRDKKQPAMWWDNYGEHCKELQRLAIRVLSQTCSSTGCKRNWSFFEHVHSKKRNRLEQQRLNALVYVKYNIQLEMRRVKKQENGEAYDPICLSDMESDNEWVVGEEDEETSQLDKSTWMDIHECFGIQDGASTSKRKRGPRNLNQDRQKKGKAKIVEEEEDVDDDDDEEEEEKEEELELMDDDEDEESDDSIEIEDI